MLFQKYITGKKSMKLYFMFPLEVPKKTYLIDFCHNSPEI